MKLVAALLALSVLSACASKSTTPAAAPIKTETPATATTTKQEEVKKDTKVSKKSKKSAAAPATATHESAAAATDVTCKSGAEERKLAISAKGAGCELNYTKAGETKAIASQISGNTKCEEVLNKVKGNLVAANYTCE